MKGPITTNSVVSCIVKDIDAELEAERKAYEISESGALIKLRDLGIFLLLLTFWSLSESVLATGDQEAKSAEPSYSSLWLRSYDETPDAAVIASDGKAHEKSTSSQYQELSFAAASLETDVKISVSGPILRARVRQTFANPSQVWVEGIYSFPLPEQAAVDHLRMRVGDRVIEGQIYEKEKAKLTYEKARKNGQRAGLLSQHQANVFTTAIANIGPGENIIVEFEYQQVIEFRSQGYAFRFPMVSTPKYVPPSSLNNPGFIAPINAVRAPNEKLGNPVTIQVDIKAGFPIEMPHSQSHSVTTKKVSDEHYLIDLAGTAELSNRDFRVSWQITPTAEPMVTVLREDAGDTSYGLLMVMPPAPSTQITMDRELILVLDISGSMQGESILQAKYSLLEAISQLKSEDFFNLVWFNDRASKLFPQSQIATPENRRIASNMISRLSANGGTDMLPAVRMALKVPSNSERLRQVVFITDGAVGNETNLFSEIRNRLGQSRLFTVGIGSAPNGFFMRKAANAGRGTFTYVGHPGEVDKKINHLFRQLEAPALVDLEFNLNGHYADILPSPLPDLYLGEPLYVSFKAKSFPKFASLKGKLDGVPSWLKVSLHSPLMHEGVAVEWVRRKIEGLLEQHREAPVSRKPEYRKEIVDLAVEHHQVSKFTSLVAVDVRPDRAGGQLNSNRIPANPPKGMGAGSKSLGQGIRLAQTATDAGRRIFIGSWLMALAVILWWLYRRTSWFRAC